MSREQEEERINEMALRIMIRKEAAKLKLRID